MNKTGMMIGGIMALGCLGACDWTPKGDNIVITVDVKQLPEFGFVVSYLNETQQAVNIDTCGHGEYIIEGEEALFLRLHNGFTEKIDLYAEKGDRIHLAYDGVSFKNGMEITGDRKKITRYLEEETYAFNLPQKVYELEFPEFMEKVNKSLTESLERFEKEKETLKKESRLFVKLEENNIRYSHSYNLLNYPHFHRIMTKSDKNVVSEQYFGELKKWMVEDPQLLALDPYRTFMKEAAWKIATENKGSESEYQKLTSQVGYIATHINHPLLKQRLLDMLIMRHTKYQGIEKALDQFYRNHVTNEELLTRYNALYNSWMRIEPGEPMIEFTAINASGKICTPKEFKGRPVCYYLWVPYYPAIREFALLKELQPLLEEKNVLLVPLFINSEQDEWRQHLENPDVQQGIHCFIGHNREFLKKCHYLSNNMYQFIWVDAQGKIITINGPRPSSGQLEEFIRKEV